MNLDQTDLELIKQTVKAAVGEATSELVTKSEFREFREEVRASHQQFYPREMVDLYLQQRDEDRLRLWEAIKALEAKVELQRNIFAHLWSSTAGRVGVCLTIAVQLYNLWRLFH